MFHRVKSETASPEQAESIKTEEGSVAEMETEQKANDLQEEEAQTDIETMTSSDDDQSAPNMTPQNEQENTMTDQNDMNTNENNQGYEAPANASYGGQRTSTTGYAGTTQYGAGRYTPQTHTEEEPASENKLVISRGITMSGEIEACDHLVIEGTVEAALKGARVLDVEEGGVFYGAVAIEEATISGRFEGEITVNGRLTIRSTGVVTGTIAYGELEVESGAMIDGRLTPVSAMRAQAAPKPAKKKPVSGKEKAAKSMEKMAPANSDGELFSEKTAAAE